jgi:alginate O-acetyltransferase complex protein AlgI
MLFNTLSFAFFLPIVFVLYWFVAKKSLSIQNLVLLVSSYFFYGCWNWHFLFLLIFSTLLDYYSAIKIEESKTEKNKKFWFLLSIGINIGFLGIFKYYNFFIDSITTSSSFLGLPIHLWTLKVILPVGISFYTFHGLSYVIDVYKNRIKAEKNFIDYSLFVSFFPLLVAGPIERATHLLPQIKANRTFNYTKAVDGLKQILWGLFKKVVIADQCAAIVNVVFDDYVHQSGSTLWMASVLFAFQIYGDFSGYSDIAIGVAKLFGIDLLRNFAYPYFSRDIAEFWRRWHISLSSWFKDYLYFPLGGSNGSMWMRARNVLIVFLVSGFWHGANFTFIIWGLLNAIYILPSIVFKTNRKHLDIVAKGKYLPSFKECISMLLTFILTVFAWIFFRSQSVYQAYHIILKIVSKSFLRIPEFHNDLTKPTLIMLFVFIIVEWRGRAQQYAIASVLKKHQKTRWLLYYSIIIAIYTCSGTKQQFIYFQF